LKQSRDGRPWVIEPTVGRTDFWVGVCIANNIDFPLTEYGSESEGRCESGIQRDTHIWINGERDPSAIVWLLIHEPKALLTRKVVGVYADSGDIRPFLTALVNYLAAL